MQSTLLAILALAVAGLVCGCAAAPQPAFKADIWVSPGGDDENPGTREAPLRTIQAAADRIDPGQVCGVREGTYLESVRPQWSGRADKPIVFRALGEVTVISGRKLGPWSQGQDGIWRAECPSSFQPKQLFADGEKLTWAQYPNDSGDPWSPNVLVLQRKDKQLAVGPGLDQPAGTWTGAKIWAIDDVRGWVAEVYTVTASAPGQLTLNRPKGWWPVGDRGYVVLRGLRPALDAPGEWLWEDGQVLLVTEDGQDPNEWQMVATDDSLAFDLSGREYVGIEGFRLLGSRISFHDASHCHAAEIRARHLTSGRDLTKGFCRDKGIGPDAQGLGFVLGGEHNTVRDSHIAFSGADGISIYGRRNTVENCVIHDCSTLGTDCAPITMTGRGHVVRHNTLYNAGRSILVHRHLAAGRIVHNHMYNAGLLCRDLGMTYCYQTDGEGTEIAYNRIHHNFAPGNGGCVGIYLDDWSRNHVVHHNVVFQVNESIALNPPKSRGNRILNNTLSAFGRTISMSLKRPQDLTGTIIRNNIFRAEVMPVKHMPNVTIDTNLAPETDPLFVAGQWDFRLRDGSPAIDAGQAMAPWTDGYAGEAPDLGAYEHGREPWTAGAPGFKAPGARQIDLQGRRKHEWKQRAACRWALPDTPQGQ